MKNDFGKNFNKKVSNFEKKFSKYAISNLSLYLIMGYAFGYIIRMVDSGLLDWLTLDPMMILRGQIWRLVTWIVVPPTSQNVLFTIITLYFYYSIGSTLERVWGTYRYNYYLFSGMLFTIIGSFLLYAALGAGNVSFGDSFKTYYVCMSIFLAFAVTFPDMEVLLMFVIPVKIKYMGIIYGVYLVLECILGGLISWVIIGSSLLNFVVFYLTSRNTFKRLSPGQVKRRQEFKSQVRHTVRVTRHKCAICGRTEESNPELEFRFCSKCNGNYEYCQDHLFTHKHVE